MVNYFSAELVENLLAHLIQQTLPISTKVTIICADNSQSSEQHKALRKIKSRLGAKEHANRQLNIQLLLNPTNLGYGCAINKSVKNQYFDYICCINPDVMLQEHALNELISHAIKNPIQGIWGGLTVDQQLNPDFRHAWQQPTLLNTFSWATGLKRLSNHPSLHDNYKHLAKETHPYPVDNVSGCFMLISANAWESTNGFDADFFLYSEEIDLCKRAKDLGFQPTVVPSSKLHHSPHSQEVSTQRLSLLYASKLLYAHKHHGLFYNVVYRSTLFLGSIIRAIITLMQARLGIAGAWAKLAITSLFYRSTINSNKGAAQ